MEAGNQKINFCCCRGSKCNELDTGSKGKKGSKGNRDRKADMGTSRSVAKVEKTTVNDMNGELNENHSGDNCIESFHYFVLWWHVGNHRRKFVNIKLKIYQSK